MNHARIATVLRHMRARDMRSIIVSASASVAYLTGEWVHPGERLLALVLRVDADPVLVANRMFALDGGRLPLLEYSDTDDAIEHLARCLPAGPVGIDKAWPSGFLMRLMAARPDIVPVPGSGPVDDARMIKDAAELCALRDSSRLNDRAMGLLIEAIEPGVSEMALCAEYERIARALGADGTSFAPLICFGAGAAQPHHASDDTRLSEGDAVIIDVGLNWGGALSDMTRTVFYGRAGARECEVYEAVRLANEAGRAAVRPGVPLSKVDRAARSVLEAAGLGAYFIHRTGHGIGMEVHEPPDVSATSPVVARPGMVFSIEPGAYLPGAFGVRIEDLVAVTEDGCDVLNRFDRTLKEL